MPRKEEEKIVIKITRTEYEFLRFTRKLDYGEFWCEVKRGMVVNVKQPQKDIKIDRWRDEGVDK